MIIWLKKRGPGVFYLVINRLFVIRHKMCIFGLWKEIATKNEEKKNEQLKIRLSISVRREGAQQKIKNNLA